jgi:hypothetical protein
LQVPNPGIRVGNNDSFVGVVSQFINDGNVVSSKVGLFNGVSFFVDDANWNIIGGGVLPIRIDNKRGGFWSDGIATRLWYFLGSKELRRTVKRLFETNNDFIRLAGQKRKWITNSSPTCYEVVRKIIIVTKFY